MIIKVKNEIRKYYKAEFRFIEADEVRVFKENIDYFIDGSVFEIDLKNVEYVKIGDEIIKGIKEN